MALTIALVFAGKNRLRYLLTTTGIFTANITTTGAATPDIQTDAPNNGLLNQMADVITAGYGKLAAGTQTQAKARALWLSDDAASVVGVNIPTAMCVIVPRSGANEWTLDANISGVDMIITAGATVAAAGTAYLDIYVPGAIGA